ncbi:hypothetical protein ABKN59_008578 [Abortiporus biennis]
MSRFQATGAQTRPRSMIVSSPSISHMPGSIFPDLPFNQSLLQPQSLDSDHPSPRHTMYLTPAPRHAARPMRSSPLAGPSLALGQDGTLTKAGVTAPATTNQEKRKYRPNRISSSPELSDLFSDAIRSGHTGGDAEATETPSESSKLSKRFSWGSVKSASRGLVPVRSRTLSGGNTSSRNTWQHQDAEVPPAVPPIPAWALSPPESLTSRRPSTAPSTSPLSPHATSHIPSPKRQSASLGKSKTMPSTSRDPEQNWMSQASTPKFSRLSLKAAGVILPVSAKEARRRSTINAGTASSHNPSNNRFSTTATGTYPSRREPKYCLPNTRPPSRSSLISTDSLPSMTQTITIPSRPFGMESRCNSSSSIGSSAMSTSPTTPSLSLSRSRKVDYHPELDSKVEIRVNDICIITASPPSVEKVVKQPEHLPPSPPSESDKQVALKGRRSIKRMWKKVVGSLRG